MHSTRYGNDTARGQPASRIGSSGEAGIIRIVWGIVHRILQVHASIAVTSSKDVLNLTVSYHSKIN